MQYASDYWLLDLVLSATYTNSGNVTSVNVRYLLMVEAGPAQTQQPTQVPADILKWHKNLSNTTVICVEAIMVCTSAVLYSTSHYHFHQQYGQNLKRTWYLVVCHSFNLFHQQVLLCRLHHQRSLHLGCFIHVSVEQTAFSAPAINTSGRSLWQVQLRHLSFPRDAVTSTCSFGEPCQRSH